jgi:hydroxyethylthiazole kinase-like uncharacterized protein yjeF
MNTINVKDMRAAEMNSEYLGLPIGLLMENAGCALAREIASRKKPTDCTILAGTGKNGGDGMTAARHLAARGFKVSLILIGAEEQIVDPNVALNWKLVKAMKSTVNVQEVRDSTLVPKISSPIVVDALLGIGMRGSLRPPILQAVKAINSSQGFHVAADIPTGIDSDSGEVSGEAVKADLTVTFHKPKPGLLKAKKYVGKLVVADVGIPPEAELYAGPGNVNQMKKKRHPDDHKGDYGRLLIVGGSETYTGAPALSGLAAQRTGVDLVYVAAPKETAQVISSYSPNLITLKLTSDHFIPRDIEVLDPFLNQATAIILGPGLGTRSDTFDAVRLLLKKIEKAGIPLLLDADGLKLFGRMKPQLKVGCVLTPHSREYEILTGEKLQEGLEQKIKQVKKAARKLGAVILLKGNVDIISNGKRVKLNCTGNPGMTVGGTGDTLAGIVGGFLSQGSNPYDAAVAGAFVNGVAGDIAYRSKGYHLLPTDIIEEIVPILENPGSLRKE